eukprot:2611404-Rhodomonas_salina.1
MVLKGVVPQTVPCSHSRSARSGLVSSNSSTAFPSLFRISSILERPTWPHHPRLSRLAQQSRYAKCVSRQGIVDSPGSLCLPLPYPGDTVL